MLRFAISGRASTMEVLLYDFVKREWVAKQRVQEALEKGSVANIDFNMVLTDKNDSSGVGSEKNFRPKMASE
jgi:hypothetical protein